MTGSWSSEGDQVMRVEAALETVPEKEGRTVRGLMAQSQTTVLCFSRHTAGPRMGLA